MAELPEFVTAGNRRLEVVLLSRVSWEGVEYDYRVCLDTDRIYLSRRVFPHRRLSALSRATSQARRFLAAAWHPV